MRDLFPNQAAAADSFLRSLGYEPDAPAGPNTPAGIGRRTAQAVLDFRHRDGANQLGGYADTTGYTALNQPQAIASFDPGSGGSPGR